MTKELREKVGEKYNGLCAYSGTPLEDDWQVEHIKPLRRNWYNGGKPLFPKNDNIDNMVPVQKLINHYKHELDLEDFREWYLGRLHIRLSKLPKNPRTEKSHRHKAYMLKVASYFGITKDNPFSGIFYFEQFTGHEIYNGDII